MKVPRRDNNDEGGKDAPSAASLLKRAASVPFDYNVLN